MEKAKQYSIHSSNRCFDKTESNSCIQRPFQYMRDSSTVTKNLSASSITSGFKTEFLCFAILGEENNYFLSYVTSKHFIYFHFKTWTIIIYQQ